MKAPVQFNLTDTHFRSTLGQSRYCRDNEGLVQNLLMNCVSTIGWTLGPVLSKEGRCVKNDCSVRSDDYVSKAEERWCSGQEGAALSCWEIRQAFGLWEAGAGRAVRLRKGKAGGKANRQDNGECRTWPQRS